LVTDVACVSRGFTALFVLVPGPTGTSEDYGTDFVGDYWSPIGPV